MKSKYGRFGIFTFFPLSVFSPKLPDFQLSVPPLPTNVASSSSSGTPDCAFLSMAAEVSISQHHPAPPRSQPPGY